MNGHHIVPLHISVFSGSCVQSVLNLRETERRKDEVAVESHRSKYNVCARSVKLYLTEENLDSIRKCWYLCYIENKENQHWRMNIAVNPFGANEGVKGFSAYDPLGCVTGWNELVPEGGFLFFLNLVESYHLFKEGGAEASKDAKGQWHGKSGLGVTTVYMEVNTFPNSVLTKAPLSSKRIPGTVVLLSC